MNAAPIAIYDSGVGGLTVMKAVISCLPHEDIVYFGDSERCPYGPRSLDEVRAFAFQILDRLTALEAKLIIIACNTATAAALKEAQSRYPIPILGVVEPGARGAVLSSGSRRIGVIATEGTVGSGIYEHFIRELDAGAAVISRACPGFVEAVEGGDVDGPAVSALAEGYLAPLREAGVDSLILGCTHYPLLQGVIGRTMGESVRLISSAEETAAEVRAILGRRSHLNPQEGSPSYRFCTTGDPEKFAELGSLFLQQRIDDVERIEL